MFRLIFFVGLYSIVAVLARNLTVKTWLDNTDQSASNFYEKLNTVQNGSWFFWGCLFLWLSYSSFEAYRKRKKELIETRRNIYSKNESEKHEARNEADREFLKRVRESPKISEKKEEYKILRGEADQYYNNKAPLNEDELRIFLDTYKGHAINPQISSKTQRIKNKSFEEVAAIEDELERLFPELDRLNLKAKSLKASLELKESSETKRASVQKENQDLLSLIAKMGGGENG